MQTSMHQIRFRGRIRDRRFRDIRLTPWFTLSVIDSRFATTRHMVLGCITIWKNIQNQYRAQVDRVVLR